MKNSLAIAALAFATTSAVAGGTSTPTPVGPAIVTNSGHMTFKVNGQVTGGPECAKTSGNRFVIQPSESTRVLAATVMQARALGESIVVVGTGTCDSTFTDSEIVYAIRLGEDRPGVR
jgi:hypothetical protein